jgi:hypothetical protein
VVEHPAAPGMPYGQEGRQAVVYALIEDGDQADAGGGVSMRRALKAFKPRYRLPALVTLADRLAAFAELPGLAVCRRVVLTPHRHRDLLGDQPDLLYAVLMPWVAGPNWFETMLGGPPPTAEQSLAMARGLAEVLSRMEERGLAHCDLSAPNVLLPVLAPAEAAPGEPPVALVDVEQLYGPGLERPAALTSGSPGYARRRGGDELWRAEADRFAGAVLLAEMLGWCDERVRAAAWGEGYFDPDEMQVDGERARLLTGALAERWGEGVARLFARAWQSDRLSDCAPFGEWLLALPDRPPVAAVPAGPGAAAPAPSAEDAARPVLEQARRLDAAGDLAGALAAYRRALALATGGSALATELALVIERWPTPAGDSADDSATDPAAAELAALFDDGAAALARGESASARELLAEVVRRQPDYRRGGQAARALLDQAERPPAAIPATAPEASTDSPRGQRWGRPAALVAGVLVVSMTLVALALLWRVGSGGAPGPAQVASAPTSAARPPGATTPVPAAAPTLAPAAPQPAVPTAVPTAADSAAEAASGTATAQVALTLVAQAAATARALPSPAVAPPPSTPAPAPPAAKPTPAAPPVGATPAAAGASGGGRITYSVGQRVYRIPARAGAAPEDISRALDRLSPEAADRWLIPSADGRWLLLETERFDRECAGWACLALVAGDLSSGSVVRANGELVRPRGVGAVAAGGDLIVYPMDKGSHELDLWAIGRRPNGWSAPRLLTGASPYAWHARPALSADGRRVVFHCGNQSYPGPGTAVCEVGVDGQGFRVVLTPADVALGDGTAVALDMPTYAPDGGIVFQVAEPSEGIWRLPAGAREAERVIDRGLARCVLPDGRIVALTGDRPGNTAGVKEIEVLTADATAGVMALIDQDVGEEAVGCGG